MNKSKDNDGHFLVMSSSSKASSAIEKKRRDGPLMLATIRDVTWNVLSMQHITLNSKRWNYSDTPGGGHKKIKRPALEVEGGHHLRKAPNPHPRRYHEWRKSRQCPITVSVFKSSHAKTLYFFFWKSIFKYLCLDPNMLTHWGLVTPYGGIDLGQQRLG